MPPCPYCGYERLNGSRRTHGEDREGHPSRGNAWDTCTSRRFTRSRAVESEGQGNRAGTRCRRPPDVGTSIGRDDHDLVLEDRRGRHGDFMSLKTTCGTSVCPGCRRLDASPCLRPPFTNPHPPRAYGISSLLGKYSSVRRGDPLEEAIRNCPACPPRRTSSRSEGSSVKAFRRVVVSTPHDRGHRTSRSRTSLPRRAPGVRQRGASTERRRPPGAKPESALGREELGRARTGGGQDTRSRRS